LAFVAALWGEGDRFAPVSLLTLVSARFDCVVFGAVITSLHTATTEIGIDMADLLGA